MEQTDKTRYPGSQVAFVSDQATPNILPAYDSRLKPERIFLLFDVARQGLAEGLRAVLQPLGIEVTFWLLDNLWDKDHIQFRLLQLFDEIGLSEQKNCSLALNLSGANQLASVAAYETFRAYEQAVFHIHPTTDELTWLLPQQKASLNVQDSIRLEVFLKAYGLRLSSVPNRSIEDGKVLSLAQSILLDREKFAAVLPTLNYLAKSAEHTLRSDIVPEKPGLKALIALFIESGLLDYHEQRLIFRDEQARFLANGGWIECHVFDALRQCREKVPQIQDIAYGVNVRRFINGQDVPNEIDVAFLCNNRLHLIECKTLLFKSRKRKQSGANTLYKLDTLAPLLGGMHARAMLVSYMDLHEYDRRRAQDLEITICSGEQLLHLKENLLRFIRGL